MPRIPEPEIERLKREVSVERQVALMDMFQREGKSLFFVN